MRLTERELQRIKDHLSYQKDVIDEHMELLREVAALRTENECLSTSLRAVEEKLSAMKLSGLHKVRSEA